MKTKAVKMADTAHLNYTEKTVSFTFRGEKFKVDLTEGDYDDSWNSITMKNGIVFDVNFSQESESHRPSFVVYPLKKNGVLYDTDTRKEFIIKITKVTGSAKEYFKR